MLADRTILRMLQLEMIIIRILIVKIDVAIGAPVRPLRLPVLDFHMTLPAFPIHESLVALRTAVRQTRLLRTSMLLLCIHIGENLPACLAGHLVFLVLGSHVAEKTAGRDVATTANMADVTQKMRYRVSVQMEKRWEILLADSAVKRVLLQKVRHDANFRFEVDLLLVSLS